MPKPWKTIRLVALALALPAPPCLAAALGPMPAWINEIHYDNLGADADEAIEIAGLAGTSLAGWQLLLYNGNGGGTYGSLNLNGILPDQSNGFGTLYFSPTSIQNGPSDGLALLDAAGTVLQFLSYEGVLTATTGAANGMTSTDIGVWERDEASNPAGYSLQLTGTGQRYGDFTWNTPMGASFGQVNHNQTFGAAVPLPTGFFLFGTGLFGLAAARVRRHS